MDQAIAHYRKSTKNAGEQSFGYGVFVQQKKKKIDERQIHRIEEDISLL